MWSWYTSRWWVGYYIWYSKEGTGRGRSPPRPFLAVPNVIAYQSTASVPITVLLLYDGPLLCGFSAHIKGLRDWQRTTAIQMLKSGLSSNSSTKTTLAAPFTRSSGCIIL